MIVRDADRRSQAKLDAAGKARAVQDQLSGKGRQRQFPDPSHGRFGGRHTQLRVDVRSGTVAILILVGFESVTSMGGEAKNAKRDVPIAVIISLLVQGAVLLPVRVFRGELLPE